MTKLEVGYLVWGVFALCVAVPESLAYFGKSFTPFPGRRANGPRTSRLVGRWRQ